MWETTRMHSNASGTETTIAGFLTKGDLFDTGLTTIGPFCPVVSTRLIEDNRPGASDWIEFEYELHGSTTTRTYPFTTPCRVLV